LLVDRSGGGLQIAGIVREIGTLSGRELLGTLLPGIRQSHYVIDLHCARGVLPAHEADGGRGVWVDQGAGLHRAPVRSGLDHEVGQIPAQDVVAGIAAIAPALHAHVIGPCRAEQRPVVPGFGARPFTARVLSVASTAFASGVVDTGGSTGAVPGNNV
jgi:hypothetical protein